jgi:hypothetical protein
MTLIDTQVLDEDDNNFAVCPVCHDPENGEALDWWVGDEADGSPRFVGPICQDCLFERY